MLMRKTQQQGATWPSPEPLGICGLSRPSKKLSFWFPTETRSHSPQNGAYDMVALNLDFEPLRRFQNWILADFIGIGRQSPADPLHHCVHADFRISTRPAPAG
jgi:hypothetical protein